MEQVIFGVAVTSAFVIGMSEAYDINLGGGVESTQSSQATEQVVEQPSKMQINWDSHGGGTSSSPEGKYDQFYKEAAQGKSFDWKVLKAIAIHESLEGQLQNPTGEDVGIMQINIHAHPDFIASGKAHDPRANILKGAEVLQEKYNEAMADSRVPADKKLDAAIAGYNAGWGNVRESLSNGERIGARTTKKNGKDYNDVVMGICNSL